MFNMECKLMKKYKMYYHGGSGNHGCEAIVRSTCKILNREMTLYSSLPEEDFKYNLDSVVNIKPDLKRNLNRKSIEYIASVLSHYIRKDDYGFIVNMNKSFFSDAEKGDIYLSIGGDNYCYKGTDILSYYNEKLHKCGAKTVLWGCSVEEKDLTPSIKKDLAKYDLIVARESISYNTLKNINKNTLLAPDPAFQLDREEMELPEGCTPGKTIGINLSPLIYEYGNEGLILDNYREMIKYIISETDNNIIFVPHVVKPNNDDRTVLKVLFDEFKTSNRVYMIDDNNCQQLKGFISKCRLFIGARTHATIAAYSSCVPTLVAGYSVKSIGIAKDIFGTDEHYVIPIQNLSDKNDLLKELIWIMENEKDIKHHLEIFIPEYKDRIYKAKELIEQL